MILHMPCIFQMTNLAPSLKFLEPKRYTRRPFSPPVSELIIKDLHFLDPFIPLTLIINYGWGFMLSWKFLFWSYFALQVLFGSKLSFKFPRIEILTYSIKNFMLSANKLTLTVNILTVKLLLFFLHGNIGQKNTYRASS